MITQRRLTEEEINELIKTAPDSETRNLKKYLDEYGVSAYKFFEGAGKDHFGLVSDDRPIYLAVLIENTDHENEFWTVVNSNVKEIVSLCKYSKRELRKWTKKYGDIYATMEKGNLENAKWTEWLGFKQVSSDNSTITFKIKGDS